MKKALSVILLCLTVLSFCACSIGKQPTPFDKLSKHPNATETISILGKPSYKADYEGPGYEATLKYRNIPAFGYDGQLFIFYDRYYDFDYSFWQLYDPDFTNEDLEKAVKKVVDSLNANFGNYTRDNGVYVWYDTVGNSYALATNPPTTLNLFYNGLSHAK